MKFNWGTGIFIVLTVFILAIITFFIFINSLDVNLVEDNYYEKELVYQERIDKISNTTSMDGDIKISQEPGIIIIQFPALDTTFIPEGTLWLYRPSDPKKDITLPLALNDSSRQVLNVNGLDKGKWILKMDWEMGGKEYYLEKGLFIEH